MDVSDSPFMQGPAKGDHLALNVLMARWGGKVTAFQHRMTAIQTMAFDLAQEIFVKPYHDHDRYGHHPLV